MKVKHQQFLGAISKLFTIFLCILSITASSKSDDPPLETEASTVIFIRHLEAVMPRLLEESGVTGASVGLLRNGEVVFLKGFGVVDDQTRTVVTPDTVFNAGSISKTVTAWGVMRLVEQGTLELDAPVSHYLQSWSLPGGNFDTGKVTIRRLLSHTAGISQPSVIEYPPDRPLFTLTEELSHSESGVRIDSVPGQGWNYSGGGYSLLQLAMEDVTGIPFAQYMRQEILLPLGMTHSDFLWTGPLRSRAASPHDKGSRIDFYRYAGLAAASLNTTARDLTRFAAAGMTGSRNEPPGRRIISPKSIALMQTPAPATDQNYGIRYGLGYNLWPVTEDEFARGHAGQNIGWAGAFWTIPATGAGLVVLTNDSEGIACYRWPFCDWVDWEAQASWGGYCRDRALHPLGLRATWAKEPAPPDGRTKDRNFMEDLLWTTYGTDEPGAAIIVSRNGETLFRGARGLADLETGRPLWTDTPVYLASVSKTMTSAAILILITRGWLNLEDRLGALLPEVPEYARTVTIRQLLTHTGGIPDIYRLLGPRFTRVTNLTVLNLLAGQGQLDFAPGSQFRYSNSGYVLLSMIVERLTGGSFGEFMDRNFFDPLNMQRTVVFDEKLPVIPMRALGYAPSDIGFRLLDYRGLDLPDGSFIPFHFTKTGSGGVYTTAEDLLRWDEFLYRDDWLDPSIRTEMFKQLIHLDDSTGMGTDEGYGFGWYVGRWGNSDLVWHDGGMLGFSTLLLRLPEQRFSLIILSNRNDVDLKEMARKILRYYFPGVGPPSSVTLTKKKWNLVP